MESDGTKEQHAQRAMRKKKKPEHQNSQEKVA